MPYLIDRERALRASEIIAVIGVRRRRVRSQLILRDNSLYRTLTKPRTLLKYAAGPEAVVGVRFAKREGPQAPWRKPP